ncbi:MAG: hypothetical protein M5U12_33370 [Verrucomicrobia bacterium]|nr:hypothetical protein [Verrucomicrobiota bacterium]
MPPLLVRGALDPVDLTYGVSALPLNAPRTWTLAPGGAPGAEVEVVLGLDRAAITVNAGELLAAVLRVTDSRGHNRVDFPVSAQPESRAGLWVGAAAVTAVGQYLKTYQRGSGDTPVLDANGKYIVTEVDTSMQPVPPSHAYPLRLIVHNPASGPATLLQRVYYGFNAVSNAVVANQESALARNLLGEARRLSASHLPWSAANPGWAFSGGLDHGAVLSATVTTPFNDQASNPFLHTYHPDHDNLNARFSAELPQGSESYRVVREITLNVKPPASDFNSRVAAGLKLKGDYREVIRLAGLARGGNTFDTRQFEVRGVFELSRIADVPTLTRVP